CPPVPTPVCPSPPGPPIPSPSPACADPHKAVPLYRAYSQDARDHFYTTDKAEMDRATSSLGYTAEGITGYIFPTQQAQTVPLYRSYQPTVLDHFYTVDKAESDNAVTTLGEVFNDVLKPRCWEKKHWHYSGSPKEK
ncbi:hypothetical protein M413DRAFT_428128, partial [Hebeloma cylindrosporum]